MTLKDFQDRIGIHLTDEALLQQAFTHRSYLNEHATLGLEHNERLEFLGDAVLELVVTDYLYRTYKEPEGVLTNWRSALVKTESLSAVAATLELSEFFRMSRGESRGNDRSRAQISANATEAVIGAIYLDQGYDSAADFIRRFIISRLPEILEQGTWVDAKSHFQEVAQDQYGLTPTYKVIGELGPDHDKRFTVGAFVGDKLLGQGDGSSKQAGQQAAAEKALAAIKATKG